jgi:hypothetical protein
LSRSSCKSVRRRLLKKRLEDELAEEKCKATEATALFNALSIGRLNHRIDDLVVGSAFVVC